MAIALHPPAPARVHDRAHAPWRRAALAAGVAVLAAAWLGPLPALAQQWFTAHMGMHLAVVAVAAPLLAIGLAGTRADPVPRAPWLFAPMLASAIEFMVVWAWHAPALHHAARDATWVRALEQGSFLAVGLLLWLSALGGCGPGALGPQRRNRAAAGVGGLLLTSMHMTLLGVLLAAAARPLYVHTDPAGHAGEMARTAAMSALHDQHVGGVLMLAVGGTVYLAGALVLLAGLLRDRAPVAADG